MYSNLRNLQFGTLKAYTYVTCQKSHTPGGYYTEAILNALVEVSKVILIH